MTLKSTLTADLVGRRYPEFKFLITPTWIRDYKQAVGYPTELVADDTLVPNTFIACFRDSEFSTFAALKIELSQLLHAGQSFRFHLPLRVGDTISSQTQITRVASKRGRSGSLVFLDLKNEFKRSSSDGMDLVAESLMSVVVRSRV